MIDQNKSQILVRNLDRLLAKQTVCELILAALAQGELSQEIFYQLQEYTLANALASDMSDARLDALTAAFRYYEPLIQ
ncbi:hypothetical protein LG200_04925 [Methylobacillus caricis]|uniref:hypothetical protein n=1 Tax=Methylobacillus caricis TaxID=1971611 RepID=UPI001CFF7CDC|nr:hypothetical protein [Methylobacillus caricis]MCB5187346.1 hypothetical protein [Methylobacillus caricis]